ncbi:hypothetical protein ACGFYM_10390 [Streptomyces sp. NPDC048231]|uniref:hypothetical protein n=1 Tax=Streptomyces sp. NPDC048231 TaxID=3365519 RepID=UPI00371740F5
MAKYEEDFELDALLEANQEEAEDAASETEGVDTRLSAEQEAAIEKIESSGYKRNTDYGGVAARRGFLFTRVEERKGINRGFFAVERESLNLVAESLGDYGEVDSSKGVFKLDGSYSEYAIQGAGRIVPAAHQISRIDWDYVTPLACDHDFDPGVIFARGAKLFPGFHVTSPNGDTCVELSQMSPIAGFFVSGGRIVRPDVVDYTLKVYTSMAAPTAERLERIRRVVDGTLFELNVKSNLALSLKPRDRVALPRVMRSFKPVKSVSFPATEIPREVAALFSFAAEARDNPPFAFLSYYQILEYYMPLASKRDSLKRIRREIRDFSFNVASDASILRVLNAAERVKGLGEEDALKILVRDCVREDTLEAFFDAEGVREHFSRKGPIAGVPSINPAATNESLAVQVAKRVYALRNRIVHAKDDPRYSERPQLLPRSSEANSLELDVMLSRFVALETIADLQD